VIRLVSVSGGKDSTATLLLARELHGDEVMAVFADTGNEHPAVYEYVDYLESTLRQPIKRLRADFTDWWWRRRDYVRDHWPLKGVPEAVIARALGVFDRGPTGNPYLDLCIIKGRFPSRMAQFCTRFLKTEPLTEYALELIDGGQMVESWQGVRMDESEARRNRHWLTGTHTRWYVDRGGGLAVVLLILRWTIADVIEAHRVAGVHMNPLYTQGMERVGCMPCINVGKDELREIAIRFSEHIDRIAEREEIVSQASKRGDTSFISAPAKGGRGERQGVGIYAVVEWSKTSRGGKQLDLLRSMNDAPACASSWGLCE
jgi:3'-phosphoadenosine 5'-phosphosulfate sulfotransferase (PAPS reductase)/FAD synthetase